MCSISGVIRPESLAAAILVVEAMNDVQSHRGPDGGGLWHDETAVLGHRRLSIIDLSGGSQPMANEDGCLHLVFNGEIYNHSDLRRWLQGKGHVFSSSCDTEVLLHLYEELGDSFVGKLDGMFAFALWDAPHRKFLLARDRAGQKPLHYFFRNGTLVFASELLALRQHPDFPAELSESAVSDFLSLQYVPSPQTIYRHVHKLPPATLLRFFPDSGRMEQENYWTLTYTPKNDISFVEAKEKVRELVIEAVRKRLMSDVPIGVFLSGGVDSAIISALVAKCSSPAKAACFTIGFDNSKYDERDKAESTCKWLFSHGFDNIEHHVKVFPENDFEEIGRLLSHFGEPFSDASMLATALLCRFAREKITVALSGDGADELFAGYDRYLAMRLANMAFLPEAWRKRLFRRLCQFLPDAGERTLTGRLRRLCNMFGTEKNHAYFTILDRCPPNLKHTLAGERLREAPDSARHFNLSFSALDRVEQCLETDFHLYLENDILPKVDRTSMAASLEVRNPFLDRELVEFTASLPLSYKLQGTKRKHILCEAFPDCLPPEVASGRKRGFGLPVADWLRGAWRDTAYETLFSSSLFDDGWISRRAAEELWQAHQDNRHDNSYILLNLIVLSLFLQQIRTVT